jgi:mRNA-degrading endonuclease RelE of RelBE toxin-antitoxin system
MNVRLTLIETHVFTREIKELLPDDDYRMLQWELVLRPEAGDLIPGGGGLRKIRWKLPGKGKRGGLRVIYYFEPPSRIYLLLPYKKSSKEDLTPGQIKVLNNLVKEHLR